jgi:uncharacterized protein YhaN
MGLRSAILRSRPQDSADVLGSRYRLLTSIGIAEVPAGEGTLPLMLDDALINADPERIQRNPRPVFRAARNLQVILPSCQAILFDGLGAENVRKPASRRH